MLADIGAADVPQLLVFNKLDALGPSGARRAGSIGSSSTGNLRTRIFASARSGEGLPELRAQLAQAAERPLPQESPAALGASA